MPATSLDTLLACLIMVVLTLSSMAGILTVVRPYLQSQASRPEMGLSLAVAEHLLLGPGDPSDWGSETNKSLASFGLAKANCTIPYALDIDKVTSLNQENVHNISFLDAFEALGMEDKPFRIRIDPVFDVTLNLTSGVQGENETTYHFDVNMDKSSLPVAASLSCYTVLGDYVANTSSYTSTLGEGSIEVALPNSVNGSALLVVIAEVEARTMSYATYCFRHNSTGDPYPQRTYVRLSPLNNTLRVDLLYPEEELVGASILTYSHHFNLTNIRNDSSTRYYSIPKLLDASPMILVVTGLNQSTSFAEWVVYPQIPLDFGSNFTREYDMIDSFSFIFLVTVNRALYECEIILGGGLSSVQG